MCSSVALVFVTRNVLLAQGQPSISHGGGTGFLNLTPATTKYNTIKHQVHHVKHTKYNTIKHQMHHVKLQNMHNIIPQTT